MTRASSQTEQPVFSASVDDCIVEGFLTDRRATIRSLKARGFTRAAVLDRARQLGLSDQFIKACSIGEAAVALRPCLRCNERFLSVGVQNRLCHRCKTRKY